MPAYAQLLVIVAAMLGFWAIVMRPARNQQKRVAQLQDSLEVGLESPDRVETLSLLAPSMAWLRGLGPNTLPPPRHCGTDLSPCRAPPVPFCLYIFLPVTVTSERSWA